MTINELVALPLDKVVEEMKKLGILSISANNVSITISEDRDEVKPEIEPSHFDDESKKDLCKCGHDIYEHNEFSECYHGCTNCKDEEIDNG